MSRGELQVELNVNGRSANILVDTGCTSTLATKTMVVMWRGISRINAIDGRGFVRCNGTSDVQLKPRGMELII